MGAPIIGRTDCPECGFKGAHVKKSEKCTFRYCPECGSQHHARTERQVADLMAKTRDLATPTPTATPAPAPAAVAPVAPPTPKPTEATATPPTPTPTPAPTAAPRKRMAGFF
jgi:hypothetical protein